MIHNDGGGDGGAMLTGGASLGRKRGQPAAREDEFGGEQDEQREVEAEPSARRRGKHESYGNGP